MMRRFTTTRRPSLLQLRKHKLVDEYWTWASHVRPGIQRNELGREVARLVKVKDRRYA